MLLTLFIVSYLYGSDVMEPCGNQGVTIPRCYRPYYLNLNSGDLTNTSSHICGSWYLSMFLFNDGTFTLISIASLMVLAILWSSLPTILHLMTSDVVMVMGQWWSLHALSEPFCKVLPDSPMYSSSQFTLPHLNLQITPHFSRMVPLSLGCIRRSLMVLPPLKYILTPCFLQIFLKLSPMPWMYGTTMYGLLLLPLLLVVLVVPWLVFVFFFCWMLTLDRAQSGYLHFFRALLRWSSSSCSRCWLGQTVLALCFKVLITLNLANRWWWLLQVLFCVCGLPIHWC